MINFDVIPLFTKVAVACTLNFLTRKLENMNPDLVSLPLSVIIDIIRLCLNGNVFTFNRK